MPKARREALAPPKAKAKALKAKKEVLKSVRSHTDKEDPCITYLPTAQDTVCEGSPIFSKEHPHEKQA